MKKILAIGTATLIVFSSSYVISNQITANQALKEQKNENKVDSSTETFSNQFLYQGASSIDNYVVDENYQVIDTTDGVNEQAENWISFTQAKYNLNQQISEGSDIVVQNNIYLDYQSGNDLTGFDSSRKMTSELKDLNIEGNGHVIYSNESINQNDITSEEYLFDNIVNTQIRNLYFVNTPLIADIVESSTFINVNFYDNDFNELNSITSDQETLGLFFNTVDSSSFNYMHLNFLPNQNPDNENTIFVGSNPESLISKFGLFIGASSNNQFQNLYLNGIDTNKFLFKFSANDGEINDNKSAFISSSKNDSFVNIDANGLYGSFIQDINNTVVENGFEANTYENFVYNSSNLLVPTPPKGKETNISQSFIDNANPSSINVSDYSDLYQDQDGNFYIKELSNSYDFAHLIFEDSSEEIILDKNFVNSDDSKYDLETEINISEQNEELVQLGTIIPSQSDSKIDIGGGEDSNIEILTPYSYNTIYFNNNLEDLTSTFNNLSSFFVLQDGVISWNFSIANNYESKTNEALAIENYSLSLIDSISSTSLGNISEENVFSGTTDLEEINPILTVTSINDPNKTLSLDFGFISNQSVLDSFNSDLNTNSFIVKESLSASYSSVKTKEGITTYNYQFKTDFDLNYISNYVEQFSITISYQDETLENQQLILAKDAQNNEFISSDNVQINGNTITFLDVAEVKTIHYQIDYYSGDSLISDPLSVRPILKGENEGTGLVAINGNYQRENEDISFEQVGNVFQIRNLSYVNSDTQEHVENISVYLSISKDGQNQLIKLNQNAENPTTFETNELSDQNNGEYLIKNIIVVNDDLNTSSNQKDIPFDAHSVIDSANYTDKKITVSIDSASTFGAFQYVLVSIIAALFLLIILLIVYLSIRKRRHSITTSPNVDNIEDYEDEE